MLALFFHSKKLLNSDVLNTTEDSNQFTKLTQFVSEINYPKHTKSESKKKGLDLSIQASYFHFQTHSTQQSSRSLLRGWVVV